MLETLSIRHDHVGFRYKDPVKHLVVTAVMHRIKAASHHRSRTTVADHYSAFLKLNRPRKDLRLGSRSTVDENNELSLERFILPALSEAWLELLSSPGF